MTRSVIFSACRPLLALLVLLLVAGTAKAADCTLIPSAFSVQSTDKGLLVETGFQVENLAVARNLLRDGAQLVLTCTLTLDRIGILRNSVLSESALRLHLRHDALTRDFLLFVEGQPVQRSRNLAHLLEPFAHDLALPIPLESPLQSGDEYRITLSLSLQYAKVPPWLERALFFWSWDVAAPVAMSKEFTY